MDNPLKKRPLAMKCTGGLKKSLPGWVVQGGQGKGGDHREGTAGGFGGKQQVDQVLIPLQETVSPSRGELMGGIEKVYRRGTGLWCGCIDEGVVEEAAPIAPGAPSQRR